LTILGYRIDTQLPKFPIAGKLVVNTLNPHSYVVAKQDPSFRDALLASDVLVPDGVGICWAAKVLHGVTVRKIAGYDIHTYMLDQASRHQLSIFYLGASTDTLEIIEANIRKDYPGIRVGSYSPPFKHVFDADDTLAMRRSVEDFAPDILFVGMTAPKQEKWVQQNRDLLSARVICSIGAVFDFYAEKVQRPSDFWIELGLEWLPRLLHEPQRLWPRMFISAPIFIWDVMREERRKTKEERRKNDSEQ
jgi:N-acetylglucosaminyldiphosphoundecaprenol N-acetyl-beta-D-mannosaminyltransferase